MGDAYDRVRDGDRPDALIQSPAHYARGGLEPIQIIDAMDLGFYEGNVVKYVCRHEHKNGLEDLRKAAWYLDRLIAKMTGEERYPAIPEGPAS